MQLVLKEAFMNDDSTSASQQASDMKDAQTDHQTTADSPDSAQLESHPQGAQVVPAEQTKPMEQASAVEGTARQIAADQAGAQAATADGTDPDQPEKVRQSI